MPRSGLVVYLTRCEGVRGFPTLFAATLASEGCRWYPEYVVYEDHMPYGQGQFLCEVRVLHPDGDMALQDRKSTRLNSSHSGESRMRSSA